MKSEQSSDEIFGVPPQMKSNPPYPVSLRLGHARVLTTHRVAIHCARAASLPREAGFHREAISSTEGGFLPPTADLIEKSTAYAVLFSTPAEPCNRRLGTLPSKVGAYHWPHCSQHPVHLSRQVNREMRGEVCKTAAESISAPFKVTSVPLIRLITN